MASTSAIQSAESSDTEYQTCKSTSDSEPSFPVSKNTSSGREISTSTTLCLTLNPPDSKTDEADVKKNEKKNQVKGGDGKKDETTTTASDIPAEESEHEAEIRAAHTVPVFDKNMKIPPMEYECYTELTENDAQLQLQQVFGVNEIEEKEEEEVFTRPKLPWEITASCNRYMMTPTRATSGRVELPKGYDMSILILCVDSNDVIYCRYYEDDIQDLTPSRSKVSKEMNKYYADAKSRKQESYNFVMEDMPIEGELVVARINRRYFDHNMPAGYGKNKEFQRARVVSVNANANPVTVTVELLDDYGRGDLSTQDIFRLNRAFTDCPPQLFTCELDLNEFIRGFRVVHKTLQSNPIPRTWPECTLNRAFLTFNGIYTSKTNRPLVDIHIRIISFPSEWLSLKSYIASNLRKVISPLNRLLENDRSTAICKVLRADDGGNLLIRLKNDLDILKKLETFLASFKFIYTERLKYLQLKPHEILPDNDKKSSNRIYVVLLPRSSTEDEEILFRVKVLTYYRVPAKYRVFCMDYGCERVVKAGELLPLSCLCEEMCAIPPLTFRVHLDSFASLEVEDDLVKTMLFNHDLGIRIVREWSFHAFLPEANLYLIPDDQEGQYNEEFQENNQDQKGQNNEEFQDNGQEQEGEDNEEFQDIDQDKVAQLKNVGKILLENKVATELSTDQKQELEILAREHARKIREKKENDTYFDKAYGEGCTFVGENYEFINSAPSNLVNLDGLVWPY